MGGVTIGYRYYAGFHAVLCHGPVDAITRIFVGDKTAWTGHQAVSGGIPIHEPYLFGGDQREGGIMGAVEVSMGGPSQMPSPYLRMLLGDMVPAFRGVTSIIAWRPQLSAMNPYVKPWRFEAIRIPKGWYESKAQIGDDANPAHIIYELLTNAEWGMGYSPGDIDEASFIAAADALYAEMFGLSLLWSDQTSVDEFIGEVLRHIDGVLFTHPRSGQFVLKLFRDDYDPDTLPTLGPSNVLSLESFSRVGWSDRVSQVTVTWVDGPTNKKQSFTVYNMAVFGMQGAGRPVPVVNDYPGLSNAAIATAVTYRDLRRASAPLAQIVLTANRQAAALTQGDVFRFDWPELEIDGMVLRVLKIDYGTLQKGAVRLECVEDIFSLGIPATAAPPASGWQNPAATVPAALAVRVVGELPYYLVVRDITGDSASALADLAAKPEAGWLAVSGVASAGTSRFDIWVDSGGGYADTGYPGNPSPSAVLASAAACADTVLHVSDAALMDFAEAGLYAWLGNECVGFLSYDAEAATVTVRRGVLDTVPAPHAAGTVLLLADGWQAAVSSPEYLSGETVAVKARTVTGAGALALDDAPADSYTLAHRMVRPYPPGRLRVNGAAYPASITGLLAIAWAHRDRTLQLAGLVGEDTGDIGPEPGTTYTIRLYVGGVLLRTEAGLTGTAYTWVDEAADNGGGLGTDLRVEVEAVRDGYVSWQAASWEGVRTGGFSPSAPAVPAATSLSATAADESIHWAWTAGGSGNRFEIVLSPSNDRGDADRRVVDAGTATSYDQAENLGMSWYGWVREVTAAGVVGPYFPSSPTAGIEGAPLGGVDLADGVTP